MIAVLATSMIAEARVFTGSSKANRVKGTKKADTIRLRSGNDSAYGRGGGDRIFGGAGRDRLLGGAGADRLQGGKAATACRAAAATTRSTSSTSARTPSSRAGPARTAAGSTRSTCRWFAAAARSSRSRAAAPDWRASAGRRRHRRCADARERHGPSVRLAAARWRRDDSRRVAHHVRRGLVRAGLYGCTADGYLRVTIGSETLDVPVDCTTGG